MARNAEKAMTALARFRQMKLEEGKVTEKRPFIASECNDRHKAEKWRRQIIGEIAKKVAQIQNAGLGEFRIRDLNDEINKLLREKNHWQDRIKELGGPDYFRIGPRMLDHEGKEVPGNRGYKYFGAARDLPGVRELFEQQPMKAPRKTRTDLMRGVGADYFGYRDEDDGVILPLEAEYEEKFVAEKIQEWKEKKASGTLPQETDEDELLYPVPVQADSDEDQPGVEMEADDDDDDMGEVGGTNRFISHVPVPSQKDIEEELVRRKKMELLHQYASESLQHQEEEARALLGV